MEKIESFKVNHELLKRGLYVSRKDYDNTTNDVAEMMNINIAELHTIEHLGATFLRNHPVYKKETIYFGPMGCRTGFYVIFKGDLNSTDIIDIMREMFKFIAEYEGEVPGADPKSCGNYLDQNLAMAKYEANKFYNETLLNLTQENLIYPN